MKAVLRYVLFVLPVLAAAYVTVVIAGNRLMEHQPVIETLAAEELPPLTDNRLSVQTWNIGYGGLGEESDFVSDGGEHVLPPSREVVDKNLAGVKQVLEQSSADIIIMQETARASMLTRGANPLATVNAALAGRDNAFSADFWIRYTPKPYCPQHGLFSSADIATQGREAISLPHENYYISGLTQRLYHMHVIRADYPGGQWTVINIHLSAFDDDADTRMQQLRAVFNFAQTEFYKGNHVIIGGDWNFEFAKPGRPSTTEEKDLFWIYPFPAEMMPEGWQVAVDATTPTVRTNERPYHANENYTTVIDGFIVSPNVTVESVEATDLDFQYTDHQPVTGRFIAE